MDQSNMFVNNNNANDNNNNNNSSIRKSAYSPQKDYQEV